MRNTFIEAIFQQTEYKNSNKWNGECDKKSPDSVRKKLYLKKRLRKKVKIYKKPFIKTQTVLLVAWYKIIAL